MSKRTAQGPQGSKDTEFEFGMQGTPDDKPQRATAAQLASRKIKEIRKRPRGTTPTGGAGESSPAFGQLSSATAFQASSFSAPSSQTGGFSFGQGQSQSFPGAAVAPGQPSQESDSAFSFSSKPFGFSAGSTAGFNAASTSTHNPFSGALFGAANTAPAQANAGAGAAPVSFGGFGTQPASQPTSLFGTTQTANSSADSSAVASIFKRKDHTDTAEAAPADSMQMSPEAKPVTTSKSNFWQMANPNEPFQKPAATSNPFSFQSATADAGKATSSKEKADSIFASKPASTQSAPAFFASQAPSSSNIFAPQAPSSNQTADSPSTKPTNGLFGAAGTTQSNLFAPVAEKSSSQGLFGSNSSGQDKPAVPTASLFGAAGTKPSKVFGPAPETSSSQGLFGSNLSGDGQPAKPAGSIFGAPGTTSSSLFGPAAEKSSSQGLFGSTSSGQDKPAVPTASLFGAAGTMPSKIFGPASDKSSSQGLFGPSSSGDGISAKLTGSNPFGGLFGTNSSTSQAPAPTKQADTQLSGGLFGGPAATKSGSQSGNSLFGDSASRLSPPSTTPSSQSLFSSKPTVEQPAASPAKPLANNSDNKAADGPLKSTSTLDPESGMKKKPVPDLPLPTLPPGTSPEVRANTELLWKVRGLDAVFKERILKYEPGVHGFDDLILFYIKVRNGMGAPLKGAPEPKQQPTHNASVNGSTTSGVFAKSFSAPGPTQAVPASSSSSTTNPFATAAANGSVSSPEMTGPIASTAKPPSSLFASPASPAPSSADSSKVAGNMFAQSALQTSQKETTPPALPKFGSGGTVDFMAQFKQKAEKTMKEEKAKRKAEEFDSDEDDEEEWERRDAEKQREKRAKLEADGAKKKKSVFRNGKFEWVDVDEPTAAEPTTTTSSTPSDKSVDQPVDKPAGESSEKPATSSLFAPSSGASFNASSPGSTTGSIFESSGQPLPASENIFGRLTPSQNDPGKESDESDEEGKVEFTKQTNPPETTDAAKSSLNAPLPAPTVEAGRSLFDRVSSPAPAAQKESASSTSGLFSASFGQGSSFGSPVTFGQNGAASAADKSSNPFGQSLSFGQSTASTPGVDKTWKPSSPIKFAADSAPVAASAPASTLASTQPSSEVGSGAATPDEEISTGEVFDMSKANAGEEEENVVFECKARAFKLATGWQLQGTGILRLLQHPGTKRARVVLRADPGGNVILNTFLKKDLDYTRQGNSVQFLVPRADQAQPEHWTVRVNAQSIEKLHPKMQEVKN
ncbi:Uncharacterized protein PECH_006000 [Penicillium ucsense]|uniref:RanBD1 domain-containing protein n=1 Tax=Penicillium ucsense TaxID=2839758 RepID=A0A8J8WGV4_9EURO|nr:Uncharacterized protein PECM_006491 [Penicillium ucsense]KAF7735963.1 Uncharacterized protein PECH_006000 [Penicillium ucsense]